MRRSPQWIAKSTTGHKLAGPFDSLRLAKRWATRSKLPVQLVNERNGQVAGWYSGELLSSTMPTEQDTTFNPVLTALG